MIIFISDAVWEHTSLLQTFFGLNDHSYSRFTLHAISIKPTFLPGILSSNESNWNSLAHVAIHERTAMVQL